MIRLKLTLAYVGTEFAGWQYQPDLRTVQGELEAVLARITGREIRVHGSGRTDTGVHALAQVAHADVPDTGIPWRKALNALLPPDICVVDAVAALPDFHARFGALAKTYCYTIWNQPEFVLPQRAPFVWRTGPLDARAMADCAEIFHGEHDFAAFQNTGTEVSGTVRTVSHIGFEPGLHPEELVLSITADGFLKQMVRNIVGCLAHAGRGKVTPQTVRSILDERDRTQAPPTAPARGLTLVHVDYGDDGFGRRKR